MPSNCFEKQVDQAVLYCSLETSRKPWKWVWTGLYAKDIPGQRIRNIAKNMVECCKQIRPKCRNEQRNEVCHRWARGGESDRSECKGSLLFQLGTLGAGNHYAEIQVVDEIYDRFAAGKMGIDFKGQVCVMIHCGSRGLGHQVATGKSSPLEKICSQWRYCSDALVAMERAMKRDQIQTNDRQLACALIHSEEGQDYLKGMYAAANYAWVNRSSMTFLARQVCSLQSLEWHSKSRHRRPLLDVSTWPRTISTCIWSTTFRTILPKWKSTSWRMVDRSLCSSIAKERRVLFPLIIHWFLLTTKSQGSPY